MELNITRQTVSINESAFAQTVEQGLDFTVTVPDYLGAVQRILKYYITPRISSKAINGQILSIEGTACFNVIYLDDNGDVSACEYTVPFSKNVELGSVFEAANISVNAKCGYLNVKPVTSSRVDVHSVIELVIQITVKRKNEIICDIDCSDVFVNRGESTATIPLAASEKNMIIEEELQLDANSLPINCIIRYDANVRVDSAKIVNGKVITKGDLAVCVLYCAVNKKEKQRFFSSVPFSQIIDIDGISEDCACDVTAEIASLEIKPRNSYDGEARSFILNAKLFLKANAVCNNSIPVIFDAYSAKLNISAKSDDVNIEHDLNSVSELFTCKKRLEFSDGDIGNVIDLWCNSLIQGYRIENNTVFISGTVNVCLLAENVSGTINYFERPIDFEYRFDSGDLPENIRLMPESCVQNSSYSIANENCLDVKIELNIGARIFEIKKINLITDISICNDEKKVSENDCSVVIYYAEKGEKTWNIAKRFCASPDEIMAVNSVGEHITDNMPLLISR